MIELLKMMALVLGVGALFGIGVVLSNLQLKSQTWCYHHHAYEDADPLFRQCFECKHIYNTEQDLVDAHNSEMLYSIKYFRDHYPEEDVYPEDYVYEPLTIANTAEINSCPYCIHDW
jgi:hypothetical protein